ncbi:hypothetical protein ACFQDN_25525 [Pseudomonas asuensis]|nr:hypothetical protein [Pseudomonas asuensis]
MNIVINQSPAHSLLQLMIHGCDLQAGTMLAQERKHEPLGSARLARHLMQGSTAFLDVYQKR